MSTLATEHAPPLHFFTSMLTKHDVRDMVTALLTQQVADAYLSASPDEYYGWVPPKTHENGKVTPGYWIGEAEKRQAEWLLDHHRVMFDHAAEQLLAYLDNAALREAADQAAAAFYAAAQHFDAVERQAEQVIEARRSLVIERRVAKAFYRAYRRALALDWNLYSPAIPEDLRRYVARQRKRGVSSPTSMVLLYLLTQDTIEHGESFQQEAVTGNDYLVTNPLVTADLDIEAPENMPSAQQRQYLKALQYQLAAEVRPPAHANHDRRDALADFEYHGLPEQLGALWLEKDAGCPTCDTPLKVKLIHAKGGFRYASVCSNYRKGCLVDPISPIFATRQEVRDWAVVEWASSKAA